MKTKQYYVNTTIGQFIVNAQNFTQAGRLVGTAIYGKGTVTHVRRKRD